ncbi:unnamed protein product [Paramecium sonneborni]|uniref:Uncharacterized protein n=1 Tax=Paramecium sonneborni TaxID=65129 RepID=A0A8S1MUH1_9CILI|nr:unnamed protein product [Paramecium sonneborni]
MNKSKTQNFHLYEPQRALQGHKAQIYVAKFNFDGQYLLTGSQDRSIILWNPYKETQLKQYFGAHNYEVQDLAILQDNSKFVSCGGDKIAFLWDVSTGQVIKKFGPHSTRINCVGIGGEQSILATGGYDCEVKIWDLKDKKQNQPIQRIKEFQDSVTQISFYHHNMIVSSIDGHIRTFDIRKGIIQEDFVKAGIFKFSSSFDDRLFALSCNDSIIRILERSSGSILAALQGSHISNQYSINCEFSWNDGMILTGSEDGKLLIYDILTGKCQVTRKLHDKCVSSIALSTQQNSFVTASFDNVALLWMEQT